jgi:hypothetical protein
MLDVVARLSACDSSHLFCLGRWLLLSERKNTCSMKLNKPNDVDVTPTNITDTRAILSTHTINLP